MLNKSYIINVMVKNSKGGKGSKRIARKDVATMAHRVLRYVKDEGEMYGIVAKHFGGQCEVVTVDGVTRLCVIRGKFKGRRRRDNNITLGTWVMIGVRDWELRGDGKTKCDLLYVYSDIDKDELKQNTPINFSELEKINTDMTGRVNDDNVMFKEDTNAGIPDDGLTGWDNDGDEVGNMVIGEAELYDEVLCKKTGAASGADADTTATDTDKDKDTKKTKEACHFEFDIDEI